MRCVPRGTAASATRLGIAELAEVAAARGADALCLSPMHALFTADPARFAPYSPSSRLFLNPLHAAPALVFGAEHVAQAMQDAGVGEAFARLEREKLIDWPASAAAKLGLLRALFDGFLGGPDADGPLGADFASFRAEGGDLLISMPPSRRCMPTGRQSMTGGAGRSTCATPTARRSPPLPHPTATRCGSTNSCNGWPTARWRRRRTGRARQACASGWSATWRSAWTRPAATPGADSTTSCWAWRSARRLTCSTRAARIGG